MRVVSGSARGLKLKTISNDSTRPTKDMVKEALFSMLQPYIIDSVFLDLFSGSGAIGIEALSRGSSFCYFCDNNKECIKVINENISNAKFTEKSKVECLDYKDMLSKVRNTGFDIIYIDPPYNLGLGLDAIKMISSYDLLKKTGILVFETDNIEDTPDFIEQYEKFKSKKYGRNNLSFYKQKGV